MQTQQSVNDVIDHLANKLSVPTAHLWSVLVAQVQVSAIQNAITIVVLLLPVLTLVAYNRRLRAWAKEAPDDDGFVLAVVYVVAVVFVGIIAANVASIIGKMMNPEYYALRDILDVFQK